jgi:mRNA interferase YafQ
MYNVHTTKKYDKDFKRIVSNNNLIAELETVIVLLATDDKPLPEKYNDHQLKGQFAEFRECHIRPDWLLVYKKTKKDLILALVRTGTHSHIFS